MLKTFKVAFFLAGAFCIVLGVVAVLIVINMFEHPVGIGMEKLAGPLMGCISLGFIATGIVLVRIGIGLKKETYSAQTSSAQN